MKRKRYTEKPIISILEEHAAGARRVLDTGTPGHLRV